MRTTFFTCCNKPYEDYIPIFIDSTLFHNKDVDVEIGVEDVNTVANLTEMLEYFNRYNARVLIRNASFDEYRIDGIYHPKCPNVVRFIEIPQLKNEFVYICDIDIIILDENIPSIHIKEMEKNGMDYSNIVRPHEKNEPKRLTGLHFSKWDAHYPLPSYVSLVMNNELNSDETFLYKIVEKQHKINESLTFRPVHGIHTSPNRAHGSTPGWGLSGYKEQWLKYRRTSNFMETEKFFSNRIKSNIQKIDDYYVQ